jgi:hypothetical protein
MEPSSCFIGHKILILISIKEKIIFNFHWFMKDEGPLIGGKDFQTSTGQGKQAQGEV